MSITSVNQVSCTFIYLVVSISHFHGFQGEGTKSIDQVMQGHIIQVSGSHKKRNIAYYVCTFSTVLLFVSAQ